MMSSQTENSLNPTIVRQFGVAFGLWAYGQDVAFSGHGQSKNPDLIAVEESETYAAVMAAIEAQDPARMVKSQIGGVAVWVEEKPSALYGVMREAMFEAYRWAPYLPAIDCYSTDRIQAPGNGSNSWTIAVESERDFSDLLSGGEDLIRTLVSEGVLQEWNICPFGTSDAGTLVCAFDTEKEALAFLARLNRWLSDTAVMAAKKRWLAAQSEITSTESPRPE